MTEQRVPNMAEYQAIVAAQDAIARAEHRGADIVIRKGADFIALDFCVGADTVGQKSFDGVETKPEAAYKDMARWVEGCEAFFLPTLDRSMATTFHDRAVENFTGTPLILTWKRTLRRFEGDEWRDLEWAYLHRVFMWPDTGQGSLNRHQRRAMERQGGK